MTCLELENGTSSTPWQAPGKVEARAVTKSIPMDSLWFRVWGLGYSAGTKNYTSYP